MCNDKPYRCPDSSDELGIVRDSMRIEAQLIDQLYENSSNKLDANKIDLICDSCKKRHECPEKAKKLAIERDNECNSSC